MPIKKKKIEFNDICKASFNDICKMKINFCFVYKYFFLLDRYRSIVLVLVLGFYPKILFKKKKKKKKKLEDLSLEGRCDVIVVKYVITQMTCTQVG